MEGSPHGLSRRDALKIGIGAGVALALDGVGVLAQSVAQSGPLLEKAIPSTGEKIPVIGMGTARFFDAVTPELRDVIRRFPELGGRLIDTAPSYGNAESVVGDIIAELKNRPRYFLATKVAVRSGDRDAIVRSMDQSMQRLHTDRIDLMQIHNVAAVDQTVPILREWKQAGRFRYIGVTTSSDRQYEEIERVMRAHPFDFVQVDYAIDNRGVEERLLPLAAERGMAVLVNGPFGRSRVFQKVAGRALPDWAAEMDATSWAQIFLKYLASHPSVTCVIPGTEKVEFLTDNMRAARGRLPDAALRRRIEEFYNGLAA